MDNKILFTARITDTEDILLLNRVRAVLVDSDRNSEILASITNPPFDEKVDAWGPRDPFIFAPLLPYYLNAPLAVGEDILVIFSNKDFKFDNQYYIQSNFSSPMRGGFNDSVEAKIGVGKGRRYKTTLTLKNIDGTYRKEKVKGIFVEPGDNGIVGRGTSDIIIKNDDVILRSGKYKGDLNPNEFPTPNGNRSFVQVSQFRTRKVKGNLVEIEVNKEKKINTKHLIEWVIKNPDSVDKFDGFVNLYVLTPNERVAIDSLNINSSIDDLKTIKQRIFFTQKTKEETIKFINDFISDCNSKSKLDNGTVLFSDNESKFPIFFRPGLPTALRLSGTFLSKTPPIHVIDIFKKIKFDKLSKESGVGFIYSKDNIIAPVITETNQFTEDRTILDDTTSTIIGGDTLYLLSHASTSSPSKTKIDLSNTLYGIDNDKVVDNIEPNTSSMVRGEELLELINLIIRFLITHAHPFPGEAPVSVTEDGSTIQNLLKEFSLATNKILNKKIKLN